MKTSSAPAGRLRHDSESILISEQQSGVISAATSSPRQIRFSVSTTAAKLNTYE
jgi:hypothetical protein